MEVKHGAGKTEYGPGVSIQLTGSEVATAIDAYLVAHNIYVNGPRTISVNGELCNSGKVYVDPSGFVIHDGKKIDGRGDPMSLYESWEPKRLTQDQIDQYDVTVVGDGALHTGRTTFKVTCKSCGNMLHECTNNPSHYIDIHDQEECHPKEVLVKPGNLSDCKQKAGSPDDQIQQTDPYFMRRAYQPKSPPVPPQKKVVRSEGSDPYDASGQRKTP